MQGNILQNKSPFVVFHKGLQWHEDMWQNLNFRMNSTCNFLVSCTIIQKQFWNVWDWHSDCTLALFDSSSVIREIRWDLTEVYRGVQFWSTLISGRPFMFWLDAAVGKNLSHIITIYCAKCFYHWPFFTFHVFTDQQNKTMNVLVVSLTQQAKTHTHARTHTHTHAHTHIPSVSCLLVIHHLLSCIMFPGSSHLYNCINL